MVAIAEDVAVVAEVEEADAVDSVLHAVVGVPEVVVEELVVEPRPR